MPNTERRVPVDPTRDITDDVTVRTQCSTCGLQLGYGAESVRNLARAIDIARQETQVTHDRQRPDCTGRMMYTSHIWRDPATDARRRC